MLFPALGEGGEGVSPGDIQRVGKQLTGQTTGDPCREQRWRTFLQRYRDSNTGLRHG